MGDKVPRGYLRRLVENQWLLEVDKPHSLAPRALQRAIVVSFARWEK